MSLVTQPQSSRTGTASTSGVPAGENPSTPLRSVTSKSGYVFPPIWSFPPFFTLQPNPSTLAHQLTLWTTLILAWAKYERVFLVNVDDPDGGGEVFWNRGIKRRLQPAAMRQMLNHMVKDGSAALDPPSKQTSTYLLYWRKPEEWGEILYAWVMDNGFGGSILTCWELTQGDLVENTDFRGLPPSLFRKALDTLVKRSKAQIIKGDGEMGDGARFF